MMLVPLGASVDSLRSMYSELFALHETIARFESLSVLMDWIESSAPSTVAT